MKKLKLQLLEDKFTISKLPVFHDLPQIIANGEMCFVMRTDDELAVITPEFMAPNNVQQELGWRSVRVEGELPFQAVGILDAMLHPLAEAGVCVFALTTYTTVYVFLHEEQLVDAVKALQQAGHEFVHKD